MTVPRRRWFSYSLRTLFLAVSVAAAIAGWTVNRLHWIRERRELLADIQVRIPSIENTWPITRLHPPVTAPGLLWMFGEIGVADLDIFIEDYDESIPCVQYEVSKRACALFPEANLRWLLSPSDHPPESRSPVSETNTTAGAISDDQEH